MEELLCSSCVGPLVNWVDQYGLSTRRYLYCPTCDELYFRRVGLLFTLGGTTPFKIQAQQFANDKIQSLAAARTKSPRFADFAFEYCQVYSPALFVSLESMHRYQSIERTFGPVVSFLEEDPWCFHSGYFRQKIFQNFRHLPPDGVTPRLALAVGMLLTKGNRIENVELRLQLGRSNLASLRSEIFEVLLGLDAIGVIEWLSR
jgi:hypothetical protein